MSLRFWYKPATQTSGSGPFPSWYAATSTYKAQEINLGASAGYTVSRVISDIRLSVEAGSTGTTLPDLWWGNLHFPYSVRSAEAVGADAGSVYNTEDHQAFQTGMLRMYNPPHIGLSGGTLATWWGGFSVSTEGQRVAAPGLANPVITTGIEPLDAFGFDNLILGFNYHWEVAVFTRVLYIKK